MHTQSVQAADSHPIRWDAGGMAHIRYPDGDLLMPAADPYDRDVAFEEAELLAGRYGNVLLEVDRHPMLVHADTSGTCARCERPARPSFSADGCTLCASCAREFVNPS